MHTPDTNGTPLLSPECRIAADSCSLILLNRLQLLEACADIQTLVVTQHIYAEITRVRNAGNTADEHELYQRLFAGNLFTTRSTNTRTFQTRAALSEADQSLIDAYYALELDGILTDDGNVCRCCRKQDIPYINSPMALFALLYNHRLTHAQYSGSLRKLYDIGRYGKCVHTYMDDLYRRYCAHTAALRQRQHTD